jgi:hypothetical protein
MTTRFTDWLTRKWQPLSSDLPRAYMVCFGTPEGQRVLQHLLDQIYTTTCPQADALALATHNGRRSVVQEILENIDLGASPDKYHQEGTYGPESRSEPVAHHAVRDF